MSGRERRSPIHMEAYRRRAFRFLDVWEIDGWRMKVHGITYDGERPTPGLVEAAREVTASRLAASAPETSHYAVGFVGIHQGRTGNFVFVDWWAEENELHHHLYTSPSERPRPLVYVTPTGLTACVWDLHLLHFEREAWVDSVLEDARADVDAYLSRRLNQDF